MTPTRWIFSLMIGWVVLSALMLLSGGDETTGWITVIVGASLVFTLPPLAILHRAWAREPTQGLQRFGRAMSLWTGFIGVIWALNVVDNSGWEPEDLNVASAAVILVGAAIWTWRTLKASDQSS